MQTGFEGCTLFSSNSSIQKVCLVSLVRETLQVSLSLFWTSSSIKNFYEITENFSFSVTLTENVNYNLPGRHVDRLYDRKNENED